MDDKIKKLREYLDSQGITQESIARKFGVGKAAINQLLTGRKPFGKNNAQRWSEEFGISAGWLLTGEGEMFSMDDDDVLWLPIINLDTRGGLTDNLEIDVAQYNVIQMPFSRDIARDGDFIMPVVGDSMTPKYSNGTFVLVRPLPCWQEYIELGATYILELLDGRRVIKDVRAGHDHDHFMLCSINPTFDSSEVAKEFIQRIYAVILSVRRDLNW